MPEIKYFLPNLVIQKGDLNKIKPKYIFDYISFITLVLQVVFVLVSCGNVKN